MPGRRPVQVQQRLAFSVQSSVAQNAMHVRRVTVTSDTRPQFPKYGTEKEGISLPAIKGLRVR